MSAALPKFPEDSVQNLCAEWWVHDVDLKLCRGRLIRTFIPHVDQEPFVLVAQARTSATAHSSASFKLEPYKMNAPPAAPTLPVAALTHPAGERQFVYRGKVRPALVVAVETAEVEKQLVSGAARWQTAKTLLVAPYYGADRDGSRGGWPPLFVERIRRAHYPQYLCDRLPIGGPAESILRFDQVQPIGTARASVEVFPYRLCDEALAYVDEWITWYLRRELLAEGPLHLARGLLVGL